MLTGTDMGVFMSNSFEDAENLEKLETYLSVALQYDKTNLSDIVSVLGSKSISEVKDTIVAGERDKIERDTAAQEQSSKDLAAAREQESVEKQLQREHEIYVENLKIQGQLEEKLMELEAQAEKEGDQEAKTEIDRKKVELEEQKLKIEKEYKERELDIKEKQVKQQNNKPKTK